MTARLSKFALNVALLTAVVFGMAAPVFAKKAPRKLLESSQVVQDLYYGDVLFYFYQDDYFQALTRVDAALDLGRVDHHLVEARLLKGGLYLSIGQHVEAGNIFKELLNDNVPDDVRNRAWFYLAKVWYQRGYYADAEHALTAIAGTLEDGLESERQLLHAEVLMGQGRYGDAINALQALPERDRFAPYARFNLGVALVRENRLDEARRALDSVGTMNGPTEELRSLRDKANLALGFAYLKDNRPDEASQVLQRVRLEGPQSNKALLGMGWADAASQRFTNALTPWQELHKRNLLDAAVQESYLAVPYAYAQLAATGQAARQYENAIDAFTTESARIDESIAAIRNGGLINALLKQDRGESMGWYWQLQNLPDAPETRYTFHLLATHEFQEGLKNFRDLKAMQLNLARWSQAASAFQDIIDTRRHAFDERMPRIDNILGQIDLEGMEARKVDIGSRIAVIERDSDVVGLATAAELEQWNKVRAIEQALQGAATNDPATEEAQAKLRLIRGVLFWNMNSSYKARLWQARKEQRELEVAVKEARRRWTLIERARVDGPARTEEFAKRVGRLKPRVEELVARLDTAAGTQNRYLADIAIRELELQKERLASYGLQAQFALAAIYDRATNAAHVTAPPTTNPAVPSTDATPGATP
ncbi:MAG TPA: tetratricopeptide repeat protein [Steroidobacteraceae bacterium]|nr:tetratricopeptide repeat protein [Steroidobacteraceae bacterium]